MAAVELEPPVTDPIDIFLPRLFIVFYKEFGVIILFKG
jgi:hypothetical protein